MAKARRRRRRQPALPEDGIVKLKMAIIQRKLTQTEVARRWRACNGSKGSTGYYYQRISNLIHGRDVPNATDRRLLSKVLQFRVSEVFGDKPLPN